MSAAASSSSSSTVSAEDAKQADNDTQQQQQQQQQLHQQEQQQQHQQQNKSKRPQRKFMVPVKRIKSPMLMAQWQRSHAYQTLAVFILQLNEDIKGGKTQGFTRTVSPVVRKIKEHLALAKQWITDIPPVKQPMRFGNKSFRTWHARVAEASEAFHKSLLSEELIEQGAATELGLYWTESFGSLQRIDYGTGHELCFVTWMCCLEQIGVLTADDHVSMILDVFNDYLLLMRELQTVYWLEPAGSKGVWGLDDYQFLPFLWGSAQASGTDATTADIANKERVAKLAGEYLFFDAVAFVLKVKTGLFAEHSPMLSDLSRLRTWRKANSGLIKMYKGEVLHKFPVAQHIYFGSILRFESPDQSSSTASTSASSSSSVPTSAMGAPLSSSSTKKKPASAAFNSLQASLLNRRGQSSIDPKLPSVLRPLGHTANSKKSDDSKKKDNDDGE